MTDYDPRTATGIPTEPVGSLPRPSWLQQAYARYDAGEITRDQLEAGQDRAVADSIEHLAATGAPIISDGEQRWSSFATYAITDTLAGTGLVNHLAGTGGQYFAIFADGHNRQLPDRDSVHSADVPYSDLLPSMFGINAGYFLIQLASERDKEWKARKRSATR
jgi:hypothetical protein